MHRSVIILIHIGYWVLFLFLLMLFYFLLMLLPTYSNFEQQQTGRFAFWVRLMFGFAVVPGAISFYTFYGFLFNKYLSKRKFWQFAIGALLTAIGAAIIGVGVETIPFFFGKNYLQWGNPIATISIVGFMSFSALINGIIGAIIRGFISWFNDMKFKEQLAEKNYEMELKLIKSQINPHFLFNTLNNIDVLIEKNPPLASTYFKKLSEIMRFMLYETKSDKIPVSKELSYIEKYIDLQKIRSFNPDFVQYTVAGEPNNIMVEPMLFIPIIENAFKHASPLKEGWVIRISFEFTPQTIEFTCENAALQTVEERTVYKGLGKGLIEKRLNLLYPNEHSLTTSFENQLYTINLIIHHAH